MWTQEYDRYDSQLILQLVIFPDLQADVEDVDFFDQVGLVGNDELEKG